MVTDKNIHQQLIWLPQVEIVVMILMSLLRFSAAKLLQLRHVQLGYAVIIAALLRASLHSRSCVRTRRDATL